MKVQLIMNVTTIHTNTHNFPPPFYIRTTVYHVASSTSRPYQKSACTIATTFFKWGISLVSVSVVALTSIYANISASISFHDIIHGFQAGRGTGMASLDNKLVHRLTSMREEFLYVIFLDLHKVYYAMDRDICLDIL